MRIVAPPLAAADVWTSATRTLTADPNPFTAIGARPNVAVGAILDLRPAAGIFRSVSPRPQVALVESGIYDGTTFDAGTTAQARPFQSAYGNSTRGPAMRNDAGGPADIMYSGFDRG